MPEIYQLTDLQISIMRVLWDRGQATVAEICEALKPTRALALTTVATMLSRLEKRGVVSHETRSRQFVYQTRVTEAEVRRTMVAELTDKLFDGDIAALMSHLLSARDVAPGDVERLKAMLDEQGSGKGTSDER